MALTPLSEARRLVFEACTRREVVRRPLADALGAVAADACVSAGAVPPFDNSAMDGFAVQAADTAGATDASPVRLRVAGTRRAGEAPDLAVGPSEAVRIMTGAPMPPGADAVVMVERTAAAGDDVDVFEAVPPGRNVRPAGDDLSPGDEVIPAGTVLTPAHLGLLATVGSTDVAVVRPPRVGVFSTGDELVEGGVALGPGQIRDSNRLVLLALARQSGFAAVDLGLAPDDEATIAAVIERGVASCDALVSSGGVSMGDFDYVKVVLDRMGDMRWMQVAIKPAKPLAFGTVARDDGTPVPVFGLPGNPVSSLVSFELFARPGLRRMAGYAPGDLDRPIVRALVDEPLRRRADGKLHLDRVAVTVADDGLHHVRSVGAQGSHQLGATARANGLAIVPDGPTVEVGGSVDVLLLAAPHASAARW